MSLTIPLELNSHKTYKYLDSEKVFKKLVCYGLFPYSIDGIFSSKTFGDLILQDIKHSSLNTTIKVKERIKAKYEYSLLPYKITRNNNAPRYLGVPHPLGFLDLCNCIKDNWDKIDKFIGNGNPNYLDTSMVIPRGENKNKRLISMESYDKEEAEEVLRLEKQIGMKYLVVADISSFFPNIYSHAIPWAIIGKAKAKKDRKTSKWYNKLDQSSRNIKGGETNGVPIGPDSSNIISEIIMSQIDKKLLKNYAYIRYIDDFQCYVKTKEEAESFIKDLSFQLEKFQLSLNTKKTKIIELPSLLTEEWVSELRHYKLASKIKKGRYIDVQDYLDLSVSMSKSKGDFSPFKYALKVVQKLQFEEYLDYKKVILYIFGITFNHPYIISSLDILMSKGLTAHKNILDQKDFLKLVEDFLNKLIEEHVDFGRSDVLIWCIHMCIKYKFNINDTDIIVKKIYNQQDFLTLTMFFYYSYSKEENTDKYFDYLINIDQKEAWLFCYELYQLDRDKVKSKNDITEYIDFYEYLADNQISFYIDEYLLYEPPF